MQRLGFISRYGNYDEFDEVAQILKHSEQSFFTGDNFQMLNSKYDQGIDRISKVIQERGETFSKYKIPESVGVPAEIGILMKYLTNPQAIAFNEVVSHWERGRDFELIFIEHNVNQFVAYFDEDKSNKKHFASPMDYMWLEADEIIQIDTFHRKKPIICLNDHEKKNFAYKFPYFCNEEVMPNYILSAYELISREVESLYVHIPKFNKRVLQHEEWYRKHLYVLFTRPTARLVVNFDVKEQFEQLHKIMRYIKEKGARISVSFLPDVDAHAL